MNRKKKLKRAAKNKVYYNESSECNINSSDIESDNSSSELLEVLLALQKTTKRKKQSRTVRKTCKRKSWNCNDSQDSQTDSFHSMGRNSSTSGKKKSPRKHKSKQPKRSISTINLDYDDEKINENIGDSHLKNIEGKIDNFFKSRRLVSDEEDNDKIDLKNEIDPIPKKPKDFYVVVSDSDEEVATERPSTSAAVNMPGTSVITDIHSISKGNSITEENKPDELMDLVDSILQPDDDQTEKLSQPDVSWEEYKRKTDEMLESVSVLIHGLKENNNKTEAPATNENEALKKVTPSCPICLETLGVREAAATICGHMFCKTCITCVAKTTKKCPTCRKILNMKKIHPVYF